MDEPQLDDHLRSIARGSVEHAATTVDLDGQLAALHERIANESGTDRDGQRSSRWMLVAAGVVVLAGVSAIVAINLSGRNDPMDPVNNSATTVETVTTNTLPASTSPPTNPTSASAWPSTVRAGEMVTITPAGTIQRACRDVVTATRSSGTTPLVGQIVDGRWVTPVDGAAAVTYLSCVGETSSSAFSFTVPIDMPTGDHEMCLTVAGDPAGCAAVVVTAPTDPTAACLGEAAAPPSLVDGTTPGDATIADEGDGRVATWAGTHAQYTVSQLLDQAPDPAWLDQAIASGEALVQGSTQAAVIPVGDPPLGNITIYLRDTADGCLRSYLVGPGLLATDAQAVAARWVNALASSDASESSVPESLRYDIGTISMLVPVAGFPHPSSPSNADDVVAASRRWVVPGCCIIGATIQNVTPLFLPEDSYKQQQIGDQEWNFYEVGPLDGSTLTATTNLADGTSVLIGVQLFSSTAAEVSAALDTAVASVQLNNTGQN